MKFLICVIVYVIAIGPPAYFAHTSWLLAKLSKMREYKKEYVLNIIAFVFCMVFIVAENVLFLIGCIQWA